MGFKVSRSPTFWANVKLRMQGEDGAPIEGEIECQFLRKDRDALKEIVMETAGKEITAESVQPLIVAWRGYNNGEDEGDTPFSIESLKRLEQMVTRSPKAILDAFMAASTGAREGN